MLGELLLLPLGSQFLPPHTVSLVNSFTGGRDAEDTEPVSALPYRGSCEDPCGICLLDLDYGAGGAAAWGAEGTG